MRAIEIRGSMRLPKTIKVELGLTSYCKNTWCSFVDSHGISFLVAY